MNIASYINELLYTSSYVVIPEFGGFVCQEFRAEINPATQMFVPPSKKVSFQPALLDHDDSLVKFIANRENISLDAAKSNIRFTISGWLMDLSEGRHVKLDGIGRIYKDQYGEFGFQADVNANYDTTSFGLGIFRFPALQEESKSKSVLNISASKKGSNFNLWRSAAVVIGVVGLLYLGTQKTDFEKFSMAGINPMIFSKSNAELRKIDEVKTSEAENQNIEVNASDIEEAKTSEAELNTVPEVVEEVTSTPIETSFMEKPFHIIVGAFKVEDNAKKLQNKLNSKGYSNASYFYEKGLYRLSISQFDDRKLAIETLRQIQNDVQKSAWIYRK